MKCYTAFSFSSNQWYLHCAELWPWSGCRIFPQTLHGERTVNFLEKRATAFIKRPEDVTDPPTEETKCCSEAHWGSMLRGKWENYTATSSGITCWLAPWCNTWINRIYLIKLYSDERLCSARPHTLCNRGYIKTVNQQHNNWMSVARVCVWFSTLSSSVGVFVWYLFAGSMTFFEADQNLYAQIRLLTVNREGFWRCSKRKAEQIMKLTMDEFHLAVSVSYCHCWLLHRAIFIITCQNVCGGKDWCIIAQCILSLF